MRIERRLTGDFEIVIILEAEDFGNVWESALGVGVIDSPRYEYRSSLLKCISEAKVVYGRVDKIILPKLIGKLYGIPLVTE